MLLDYCSLRFPSWSLPLSSYTERRTWYAIRLTSSPMLPTADFRLHKRRLLRPGSCVPHQCVFFSTLYALRIRSCIAAVVSCAFHLSSCFFRTSASFLRLTPWPALVSCYASPHESWRLCPAIPVGASHSLWLTPILRASRLTSCHLVTAFRFLCSPSHSALVNAHVLLHGSCCLFLASRCMLLACFV